MILHKRIFEMRGLPIYLQPNQYDKNFVGIEVEYELRKYGTYNIDTPQYWSSHIDNSLRGGVEFVTNPVDISTLDYKNVFKYLNRWLDKYKEKILDSDRTGTHVHFNMLGFTYQEVMNTLFHLYLFENVFIGLQNPRRKSNNFCLAFSDTEHIFDTLMQVFDREAFEIKFLNTGNKYYAFNFDSLFTRGTLEARFFDTCLDSSKLKSEISLIQEIINTFRGQSIRNTIAIINNNGMDQLKTFLSPKTGEFLFNTKRQLTEHSLYENMPALIDLGRKLENVSV